MAAPRPSHPVLLEAVAAFVVALLFGFLALRKEVSSDLVRTLWVAVSALWLMVGAGLVWRSIRAARGAEPRPPATAPRKVKQPPPDEGKDRGGPEQPRPGRLEQLNRKIETTAEETGLGGATRRAVVATTAFGRRLAPPPAVSGWVLLSALIGTFFYVRIQTKVSCCDALGYLGAGGDINANGLFTDWPQSDLRTYFYPWFLSVLTGWGKEQGLVTTGLVFLVQLVVHIAACLTLYAALRPLWPKAATWSLPLLLCNPLLLAYVPDTLTESLTISFTILWFAVVARLARASGTGGRLLLWTALGAVTGTAFMVRPANLVLILAMLAVAAVLLVQALRSRSGRRPSLLLLPTALVLAFAVPLLPQLKINVGQYDTWSVFPTRDLGNFQLQTGVQMIKYVTDVRGPTGSSAPYYNPFLGEAGTNAIPEDPLDYYWQQPWDGIRLVGLHVFNSVNPDFLFTYVHDAQPSYRTPLVLGMQTLFYAGLTAVVGLIVGVVRGRTRGVRLPLDVGLVTVVLGSMALNSVVAVETRFGVVTVIGLSIALAEGPPMWRRASPLRRSLWLLGLLAWLVFSLWLTQWVLRQAPVLAPMN